MRETVALLTTIFLFINTVPVLAAACDPTVQVTAGGTTVSGGSSTASVTSGSQVTFSVSFPSGYPSGCSANTVSEVDYYITPTGNTTSVEACAGSNDSSNSNPNFSCSWTSSSGGTFSVMAYYGGSSSNNVYPSMNIDIVGAGISTTVQGTDFGEQNFNNAQGGGTDWIEGDNQFCSTNWPYNGYSIGYPDGSCEWTNTVTNQQPGSSSVSSIDGLDDAMHTLSDFSKFSQSLLNLDTAATTVDNWYGQAAKWIAPACTGADACTSTAFNQSACSVTSCNKGSDGRLLSLYCPPGLCATPKDLFGDWQNLMTNWLTNSGSYYSSSSAWCVPTSETTVLNGVSTTCTDGHPCGSASCAGNTPCIAGQVCADGSICTVRPGLCVNGSACSTAEDMYIQSNVAPTSCSDSSTCSTTLAGQCANGNVCSVWGDLPHVIACLNYNGGPSSATAPTAICPENYFCSTMGTCTTGAACTGTGACTGGTCVNGLCSNSQICAFPANSAVAAFQQCLSALGQACQTKGTISQPVVCGPAYIGRSLAYTDLSGGAAPAFDQCSSGKFMKYIQDSLTLYTHEANKFSTRAKYLTDVYSRGYTAQNIFAQAHTALADFFKTCSGCADGSSCGAKTTNQCADGSECNVNATTTCQDGGPATQLMFARNKVASNTQPTHILPNAVIYGWKDQDYPNGHIGYTHVVKVLAFSPGRGGPRATAAAFGPGFIQSLLPWIDEWEDWMNIYYGLAARDGYVYVDVKRWDEDHSSGALTFPNTHQLWQFLFHSPTPTDVTQPATNLMGNCMGQTLTSGCPAGATSCSVGYGLLPETVTGLSLAMTPPNGATVSSDANTVKYLGQAFMLNDEGDGAIDPIVAAEAKNGVGASTGNYRACLKNADDLLGYGVETRACARYIASRNPGAVSSGYSGTGDSDYSLKFVSCDSISSLKPGGALNGIDDLMAGEI